MQGIWVRSLVQEDSTSHKASVELVHHNHWVQALEPESHSYWAHRLQLLKPKRDRSPHNENPLTMTKSSPLLPQLEKAHNTAMKTQCNQK